MAFARFSLSLAILAALSLSTIPAHADGVPDPTTLTGVVPTGSTGVSITNTLDPVFGVNSFQVNVPDPSGSFVNSGGVNYPQYEPGGFGFTPTEKNFFYLASFTYDGTAGQLTAIGGYGMIIHENSIKGGGFYYINTAQTESVVTRKGFKAFTVVATAAAPGSGASAQFAGFSGSDNPILAADRLCVVFYGVTNGSTDIVSMIIVGPGTRAPRIIEWKADGSGIAGTHRPTTYVMSPADQTYNFQE